jgi:hypothetical protein
MRLLDSIARWLGRAILRLYPRATVNGVKTIISDLEAPRETCLEQLSESIDVLRAVDERRAKWLMRYVRRIVLWRGHYCFADNYGGVYISTEFLLDAEAELVASVLVHEAVHHRLKRLGIKTVPQLQTRIERICTKEQAEFLRRLGQKGDAWAAEVEAALADPWWGEIREQEKIEELIARGMPRSIGWLIKRRVQGTSLPAQGARSDIGSEEVSPPSVRERL